jgi:AmmeMemoRadiSam system protein B
MRIYEPHRKKRRPPTVAGIFYPDDKTELEERIRAFGLYYGMGGRAAALIAPHGAWHISGSVAGAAFGAAAGRARPEHDRKAVSQVALLGNTHDTSYEGIFVSDSRYFDTPLGPIPVNRKLSKALASCSTMIEINDIPHLREHTLEVQLPFIKYCFPRAALIPVLMGCAGGAPPHAQGTLIASLASALRIVLEPIMDSTLIVASANLSVHQNAEQSLEQAETCVRLLENGEGGAFISGLREGRLKVCGGFALAALLQSGLLAGKTAKLVSRRPLAKALGEEHTIVHYGSLSYE